MMSWLISHGQELLAIYGAIVLVCSTIVKLTPSTKDDAVWAKIEKVLDMFSVVFTKADAKKLEKAK